MSNLERLTNSFYDSPLIKVFEIECTHIATQEKEFIVFDIQIKGCHLIAEHVSLTQEEQDSTQVAFKLIEIDSDFSLDKNLHNLFEECQTAIVSSDFFDLAK